MARAFFEFRFLIQDLADNTVAQIHGAKLDLDLPTGERWTSDWNSTYDDIESGRTRSWISFDVKRAVFDSIRNRNVKAHVSFAVRVYRVGKSSALSFQGDKLHFADGSRCTIDVSGMKVKCFSALKEPGGFVIYTDLPNSDCPPVSSEEERQPWASLPATYTSFRGTLTQILASALSNNSNSPSPVATFTKIRKLLSPSAQAQNCSSQLPSFNTRRAQKSIWVK